MAYIKAKAKITFDKWGINLPYSQIKTGGHNLYNLIISSAGLIKFVCVIQLFTSFTELARRHTIFVLYSYLVKLLINLAQLTKLECVVQLFTGEATLIISLILFSSLNITFCSATTKFKISHCRNLEN